MIVLIAIITGVIGWGRMDQTMKFRELDQMKNIIYKRQNAIKAEDL